MPNDKYNNKISIIMPAYNCGHCISSSIRQVYNTMREEELNFEIIIVNDGSSDNTSDAVLETMRELNSDSIKLISYPKNMGKGYAFVRGFKESTGDIIVLFDADLDIPPPQIPFMVKILKRKNADIVITNKWHPLSKTQASFKRFALSTGFNFLVRFLTGISLRDTQTGAKCFRRHVLNAITKRLFVKRFAIDVEILLLAQKMGFKIVEVPSIATINLSSNFYVNDIMKMFLELLSITYRHGRVFNSKRR
ncbi:MAG: glycosyltransferase [Candidatus Baldrarchaeia archaeon]